MLRRTNIATNFMLSVGEWIMMVINLKNKASAKRNKARQMLLIASLPDQRGCRSRRSGRGASDGFACRCRGMIVGRVLSILMKFESIARNLRVLCAPMQSLRRCS